MDEREFIIFKSTYLRFLKIPSPFVILRSGATKNPAVKNKIKCGILLPTSRDQNNNDFRFFKLHHSLFILVFLFTSQSLFSQFLSNIHLFPDSQYVKTFTANAHANTMTIEDIELSRNLRASMGGTFPVFAFEMLDRPMQASFGASVHFDLRPSGQTHIISSEYYIDYFILDVLIQEKIEDALRMTVRFAAGHTSHHLSDNWAEITNQTNAIHYARDYVRLFFVLSKSEGMQAYIGADYGYIFTINNRIPKPWTFQAGGEAMLFRLYESITAYAALDCKLRQEAGFAATTTYQVGIKMPMQRHRTLRLAYQFRHGVDERGQFFPQHRMLSTLGIYIEI